ncbi:MAG TPA: sigma-70 family RNA polymerase sigma factor [Gemmatimonadales bacterium]|nr:sigma-70 family RNA polymerase sigma factor [Gemmatimonadales bacterium]
MEDWVAGLQRGSPDAAWDLFLSRYRRLIFAAIRHYAQDYDDVMDVFARVCESLREDDLRRLRDYVAEPEHRARFSTWLVTVVRHITVDWFRERDGRRRISAVAEKLPALQRRLFDLVFVDHKSHSEAYELLRSRDMPALSYREFQSELRATYRAVTEGRKGQILRELGSVPSIEVEADSLPDKDPPISRAELDKALTCLSPEDRIAVELYVVEELPGEDVARILGLPNTKAVYNRVYRALAAVRERLQQAGLEREDL